MSAARAEDGGAAGGGRFTASTIDLTERAAVLVEEYGSGWPDPTEDVVLEGLVTALHNDDARVRDRAERTLREIKQQRLITWLRRQLTESDPRGAARIAIVIARLHLQELVPDLVGVAMRSSSADLDTIGRTLKAFPHFRTLIDWIQAPADDMERIEREEAADRRAASFVQRLDAADVEGKVALMARLPEKIESGPLASALSQLAVEDASDEVRMAALAVLQRADRAVRLETADALLKRGSVPLRIAALDLATGGSVDEMSLLVRALHDKSPNVAKEAITRLGVEPAPESLAILWGALVGVSRERQQLILELLERFDHRAVSLLARQILRSSQSRERALGAWVLGAVDAKGSRTLLLEALTDPAPEVRVEAIGGLATVGDSEVVAAIGQRVRDPEPTVRARAIEVLGGVDAELSADYLVDALKDPADEVRQAAEEALLAQRPAAVAAALVPRLGSPSHRRVAQSLLLQVGTPAIPALVAAAPGAPRKLAELIASVLTDIGAEEHLLADLDARDPQVRIAALVGLGVISATEHIRAIATRLEDPVAAVRIQAAEVLGDLGDESALEPLKKAFVSDPDMGVVATIEGALRRLTEDQPDVD